MELRRQDTLSITFKHPPGTDPSNGSLFHPWECALRLEQVKLHGIETGARIITSRRGRRKTDYYYSTTTNTLYVKLLHQKRSDTVVVTFLGLRAVWL
jgi:hypothetical protein